MTETTTSAVDQTGACHYLVCHGEVQAERAAILAGTTVGVYTEIGDPLAWQDARNILKLGLAPIYRPSQGEFPEADLLAADETGENNTSPTAPAQPVPVPVTSGQGAMPPGPPGTGTGEPGTGIKRAASTSAEVLKEQSENPDDV